MPQRNTIRKYAAGFHYHIYNRGVEKRNIFIDKQDYNNFLGIIKSYLTPKPSIDTTKPKTKEQLYWRSKLEKDEIEILCYCLMPNHFHFLVKQNSKNGITRFMRRLSNSYVKYFNKKHERVGGLFQGKFKAALVKSDAYLLQLSKYIHLNPIGLEVGPLYKYPYSSYNNYLGIKETVWIKPETIMNFFRRSRKSLLYLRKVNTYRSFVEKNINKYALDISNLILE